MTSNVQNTHPAWTILEDYVNIFHILERIVESNHMFMGQRPVDLNLFFYCFFQCYLRQRFLGDNFTRKRFVCGHFSYFIANPKSTLKYTKMTI